MTATLTPDRTRAILGALERADRRSAQRTGDDPMPREYLTALAQAVAPEVDELPASADVDELRARIVAAEDDRDRALAGLDDAQRVNAQQAGQIKSLLAEVEQHRENAANTRLTLQRRIDELTTELGNARAALGEARKAPAAEHRHTYEITDTGAILPCAGEVDGRPCGLPYPRDVLAGLLADTEDDEPDVEPMAALLARVRDELADWGGSR